MIRFERSPEPADFDAKVRTPGKLWLAREAKGRPPNYWRHAAEHLQAAFRDLCAYSATWLSAPGTVDHFVSCDEDRTQAYEWNNLRYAAGWINSAKGKLRSSEILDPFEVGDDWFEIILPSCQLRVTERCPPEYKARATTMLKRLRLGHDESVVRFRQQFYRMYLDGWPLEKLEEKAPLIARAVRKQAAAKREDPA